MYDSKHRPASPLPPPPPSPCEARPPRALLAAYAVDADLRRAALDVLQRLTSKERAARKRSRLSPVPFEDKQQGSGRRKIELHVLLLPSTHHSDMDTQDTVLEELQEAGVRLHIHPIITSTAARLSLSGSPLRLALLQAFSAGGVYEQLLLDELASAGFVFGEQASEGNDACKAFLEILGEKTATAFPSAKAQPTITLYIAPHPSSSNFDLDLPVEQVLALRLVNSAADTFKAASPPPPSQRRSRLSWTSLPIPPSSPSSSRRSSHSPLPSFLNSIASSSPSSPNLKPLVLRPAPGPIQSVSLRLSLDTADVLFRVTETLTPIEASGKRFPRPRSPSSPPTPPASPPRRSVSTIPSFRLDDAPAPRVVARQDTTSSSASTVFQAGRHQPLTKQPLNRSDTVLTTASSDFDREPPLSELRALLQRRMGRAEQKLAA
ncbi:hypothetical protein JCM11641_002671 [Rhodosporidiobolus odoratus]